MKMPFPGMDPYLEHPHLWQGFHTRLVVELANALQPLLRPRYVASIEERLYVVTPHQQRIPDVTVKKHRLSSRRQATVGTAELAKPIVVEVEPLAIRERFLQILDRYHDQRVVTVIEIVSPSNKRPGNGRKSYLRKQKESLASKANLVEIDLLRKGHHVLSVPSVEAEACRPFAYLICVNRRTNRNRFELYPWSLRDRLPSIGLPLAPPDPDVALPLQDAIEHLYEQSEYPYRVRYDQPCAPALEPDDQEWASERWAAYRAIHPELGTPPRKR
jgi:hypothetical protein